jgi:hypothetical protein
MSTKNVYIGKGKLAGKGVYAVRDFKKGEIVKFYNLKLLTQPDFDSLPKNEQMFVHSFSGKMYLFPEPSRYTNHSAKPNTRPDFKRMCDIAIRPIKKGEMVTINATYEVRFELESFIAVHEKTKEVSEFQWLKGGYRNAVVRYALPNKKKKQLTMKRLEGNWRILKEITLK